MGTAAWQPQMRALKVCRLWERDGDSRVAAPNARSRSLQTSGKRWGQPRGSPKCALSKSADFGKEMGTAAWQPQMRAPEVCRLRERDGDSRVAAPNARSRSLQTSGERWGEPRGSPKCALPKSADFGKEMGTAAWQPQMRAL